MSRRPTSSGWVTTDSRLKYEAEHEPPSSMAPVEVPEMFLKKFPNKISTEDWLDLCSLMQDYRSKSFTELSRHIRDMDTSKEDSDYRHKYSVLRKDYDSVYDNYNYIEEKYREQHER